MPQNLIPRKFTQQFWDCCTEWLCKVNGHTVSSGIQDENIFLNYQLKLGVTWYLLIWLNKFCIGIFTKTEGCEGGSFHIWVNVTFLDSVANTSKTLPNLWFSQDSDESTSLLGYDDVLVGKLSSMFQRNLMPPSSRSLNTTYILNMEASSSSKMFATIYQLKHHIPEDLNLHTRKTTQFLQWW